VFAAWTAGSYTGHATNRSCYIDSDDLAAGYATGFVDAECFGLPVTVFTPDNMIRYLSRYVREEVPKRAKYTVARDAVRAVGDLAAQILINDTALREVWDGREKISLMKRARSRNWRQLEWPGWYFEELAISILKSADAGFVPGGVTYGNATLDLFHVIPWDLKAHSSRTGRSTDEIPANSTEAIEGAIEDYGYIGFIVLEGDPVPDDDGSFQQWHEELKGERSGFSRKREERGAASRRRKKAFVPKRIRVVVIDASALAILPSFQTGMRNSSGKPRTEKKSLRLSELPPDCIVADELIHVIDFGGKG
jgi:hypothetical protein